MKNENSIKTYACYSKNKTILNKSSSGGIFYSLAAEIITKYKGVVYGCVIDWDNVYHTRAESIDDLMPMLGSKYVRSNLKNTFNECYEDLKNDRWVLYSGTPCQINALHFYLKNKGNNLDKLVTVDVICHGTPKIEYWREYLKTNFPNQKSPVNFRYKKNGWENYYIKIGDYEAPINEDPYCKAFLNNDILHESCFNCKSKGENRSSDITMGDFWGAENVCPNYVNRIGTSLIIIRKKQDLILRIIKHTCFLREVPYVTSIYPIQSPYYRSAKINSTKIISNGELLLKERQGPLFKFSNMNHNKGIKSFLLSIFEKVNHYNYNIFYNHQKRKRNNRVGIITDFGYGNYGNRLQNYALIESIKKNNKIPTNIRFITKHYSFIDAIYTRIKRFKRNDVYFPYLEPVYLASTMYEGKTFTFTKTAQKQRRLCRFETIIVGSDQIWNASYHQFSHDLEYSLGNFGIINKPFKLVSYAASICMNDFNEDEKFLYFNSLKQFDSISVREFQSKELLASIGINSTITLDPTLLLEYDEWSVAIEKYKRLEPPTKNYLFVYLLNANLDSFPTFGFENIVNIMKEEDVYHSSNQFDFINLLKNSSIVVTNSFHGLVFSLIFKKKVYLMGRNREGMSSRIEELFKLLNVDLKYNQLYDLSLCNLSILQKKKTESLSFLMKALSK